MNKQDLINNRKTLYYDKLVECDMAEPHLINYKSAYAINMEIKNMCVRLMNDVNEPSGKDVIKQLENEVETMVTILNSIDSKSCLASDYLNVKIDLLQEHISFKKSILCVDNVLKKREE